MLFADLRYDYVRTAPCRLEDASFADFEKIFAELEDNGRKAIAATSVKPRRIGIKRAADMRYVGQEHPVTVDLPLKVFARQDRAAIKRHFDDMHLQRYGTSAPAEPAEIVSLRTTVTGEMRAPRHEKVRKGSATPPRAAVTGKRKAYFGKRFVATLTYSRAALLAGNKISGPALIEEHASTTVLMPGDRLVVDAYGNLVITIGAR
jgi:N-methylhydantoinase A